MSEAASKTRTRIEQYTKVGQRYGSVVVLENIGKRANFKSSHNRSYFKIRCDCGNEYEICNSDFKKDKDPKCHNCKLLPIRTVKIGEKFDKLTVIEYNFDKPKIRVNCLCECGNFKLIEPRHLKINKTNNCGCDVRGLYRGVQCLSLSEFNRIKHGATSRGLLFDVNIKDIYALYEHQDMRCALSGVPLVMVRKSIGETTASLDRKDFKIGYIMDNVQWIHKNLNIMKGRLSDEKFIELCKSVAYHNHTT